MALQTTIKMVWAKHNRRLCFAHTALTEDCAMCNISPMTTRQYLDPAYSLIKRFSGPDGKLGQGIDAVAAIVGRDRTNVYRWMIPTEKGGTGGFIPGPAQRRLSEYAQKSRGAPEWLKEFFGGASRAA